MANKGGLTFKGNVEEELVVERGSIIERDSLESGFTTERDGGRLTGRYIALINHMSPLC